MLGEIKEGATVPGGVPGPSQSRTGSGVPERGPNLPRGEVRGGHSRQKESAQRLGSGTGKEGTDVRAVGQGEVTVSLPSESA